MMITKRRRQGPERSEAIAPGRRARQRDEHCAAISAELDDAIPMRHARQPSLYVSAARLDLAAVDPAEFGVHKKALVWLSEAGRPGPGDGPFEFHDALQCDLECLLDYERFVRWALVGHRVFFRDEAVEGADSDWSARSAWRRKVLARLRSARMKVRPEARWRHDHEFPTTPVSVVGEVAGFLPDRAKETTLVRVAAAAVDPERRREEFSIPVADLLDYDTFATRHLLMTGVVFALPDVENAAIEREAVRNWRAFLAAAFEREAAAAPERLYLD